MAFVNGFDHQSGIHCGAGALRNVAAYYGLQYSEAACFGIGGGPAFVRYDPPGESWARYRTSPTWLERAFFERLGVSHLYHEGDDFETAWAEVTARIDTDDPVLLFLDPAALEYVAADPPHLPPHVAVLIGYDEETAHLSDATRDDLVTVARSTLRDAWRIDRFVPLERAYLVVNRGRATVEGNDAVAAGIRQTATYMLDPLQVRRDARGPGAEGLDALRSFGDALEAWPERSDPIRPVRAARRTIDEHGEGAAYRSLYADALGELGRRVGLRYDVADRMADVAAAWRTVGTRLDEIVASDRHRRARFEEAAALVGDVADREEAIFEDVASELGAVSDRP